MCWTMVTTRDYPVVDENGKVVVESGPLASRKGEKGQRCAKTAS